jgi:uncharacterized protein DUF4377
MSHSARLAAGLLVIGSACSSPKPAEGPGALDGSEGLGAAGASPAAAAEPAPVIVESTAATPSTPAPSAATSPAAPSASDASVVETLFVREGLVDCQGEAAQKCLQVRGSESEEWRSFYASIEGFEHDPSHAYELRVEVTKVPNAPADAPSLRYRLLEVVSKRKVAKK